MKYFLVSLAIAIASIMPLFQHTGTLYVNNGVVVSVDTEHNIVTYKDNNGHLWSFSDAEGWHTMDRITVIMDDNNTNIVTDDIIVTYKHSD